MIRLTRAWRHSALASIAAVSAGALACVPSYEFSQPDGGDAAVLDAGARDATSGVDATSHPDASAAADAPDDVTSADASDEAAPQIFVDQNFYQGSACAMHDGSLWCWGNNNANQYGQLGLAANVTLDAGGAYLHPQRVPTTTTPTQVGMQAEAMCTLYGRTVMCRGSNRGSQLANASVSYNTVEEVPVINLPPVDTIAVAAGTTCGLVLSGDAGGNSNVWCWGWNKEAETGRAIDDPHDYQKAWPLTGHLDGGPTAIVSNAKAIAGGGYHFCALTTDDKILCWGANDNFESGPKPGDACSGGFSASCSPNPQEVTIPGEIPTQLALGDAFSCALVQSGKVYCWGKNDVNQLGTGGVAPANTCPGPSPGTTISCSSTPVAVWHLAGMQRIFAGGVNACALDAAQHAFCWGDDSQGQLGIGTTNGDPFTHEILDENTSQPIPFDELAMGGSKVCGRSGNTFYCWGGLDLGTQPAGDAAAPDHTWPAPVQF